MAHRPVIVATFTTVGAAVATAVAHGQVDGQRRPLRGCEAPSVAAALPTLRESGVAIVDGVINAKLVAAIKATAAYRGMPTRLERSRRGRVDSSTPLQPAWTPSAVGRLHRREETLDASDVKVLERVERLIWPLVVDFFADGDADEAKKYAYEQGAPTPDGYKLWQKCDVYRSELQLLNAVPGGMSQAWHSDNHEKGLSFIVPLADFTLANGGTQLLPGSHVGNWSAVATRGAGCIVAPVGAIAAYDSRTYHRGPVNETDHGRPAIILCYDRKSTPPPGISANGSIAHSFLAVFLNIASTYWGKFAPPPAAR